MRPVAAAMSALPAKLDAAVSRENARPNCILRTCRRLKSEVAPL